MVDFGLWNYYLIDGDWDSGDLCDGLCLLRAEVGDPDGAGLPGGNGRLHVAPHGHVVRGNKVDLKPKKALSSIKMGSCNVAIARTFLTNLATGKAMLPCTAALSLSEIKKESNFIPRL